MFIEYGANVTCFLYFDDVTLLPILARVLRYSKYTRCFEERKERTYDI